MKRLAGVFLISLLLFQVVFADYGSSVIATRSGNVKPANPQQINASISANSTTNRDSTIPALLSDGDTFVSNSSILEGKVNLTQSNFTSSSGVPTTSPGKFESSNHTPPVNVNYSMAVPSNSSSKNEGIGVASQPKEKASMQPTALNSSIEKTGQARQGGLLSRIFSSTENNSSSEKIMKRGEERESFVSRIIKWFTG